MKKLNLTIFLVLVSCISALAQFKVATDGTASVETTTGESAFNGTHNIIGVKGVRTSYNSEWGYGVYGESQNFYTHYSVGVAGIATTSSGNRYNYGRAYGVWGEAKLAENGYNYGVYGKLADNYFGTAIYGTSDVDDIGVQIGGRYAGYFNGNVYVTANFTANTISAIYGYTGRWLVEGDSTDITDITRSTTAINDNIEQLSDKIAMLSVVSTTNQKQVNENATMTATEFSNSEIVQPASDAHYSLSTSQIESVFPELIYSLDDGKKYINYTELIPILVQSIAELKAEIAILKSDNSVVKMNKSRAINTNIENEDITSVISLSQNNPNPWNINTAITINVPEKIKTATLYFYDLKGVQKHSVEILNRGEQIINISSTDFTPGIYIYTLVTDGVSNGAKRMILTE